MANLKQLIYTGTVEGFRIWGMSDGLSPEIQRDAQNIFDTFKVTEAVAERVKRGETDVELPVRYKYSARNGGYNLSKLGYLGAELLDPSSFNNYFLHMYHTDTSFTYSPASYFYTPGFFRSRLTKDQAGYPSARQPLPCVEETAEGCNAISDAAELIASEKDIDLLSCIANDVINALSGSLHGLVFLKCGSGNRLIRYINAVSLLFPTSVAARITFDTACGSSGEALTDIITGFADGVEDGSFARGKDKSGAQYKRYDMTALNMSVDMSRVPQWISDLVRALFFDKNTASEKLKTYRVILDTSSSEHMQSAMTEAADTLNKIFDLSELGVDKIADMLSEYRKGNTAEAVKKISELTDNAANEGFTVFGRFMKYILSLNGVKDEVDEIVRKKICIPQYASALLERLMNGDNGGEAELEFFSEYGFGVELNKLLIECIDGYVLNKADGIADGIWMADDDIIRRCGVLLKYGSLKAADTIETAVMGRLMTDKRSVLDYCIKRDNEIFGEKISAVASIFPQRIGDTLSDLVSEWLTMGMDELCGRYAADNGGRIETVRCVTNANEYFGDALALFSEALGRFITETEKGGEYAYSIFCGIISDAASSVSADTENGVHTVSAATVMYDDLAGRVSEDALKSAMDHSALRYATEKGSALALGVINGDEEAIYIFAKIYGDGKDNGAADKLKLALECRCRESAARNVAYFIDGKLIEAKRSQSIIDDMGYSELSSLSFGIFAEELKKELDNRINELVVRYLAAASEEFRLPLDEVAKYDAAFAEKFKEKIYKYLPGDTAFIDRMSESIIISGKADEGRERLLTVGVLGEDIDKMLSDSFARIIDREFSALISGAFTGEERFDRVYTEASVYVPENAEKLRKGLCAAAPTRLTSAVAELIVGSDAPLLDTVSVIDKYSVSDDERTVFFSALTAELRARIERDRANIASDIVWNGGKNTEILLGVLDNYASAVRGEASRCLLEWLCGDGGRVMLTDVMKDCFEGEAKGLPALFGFFEKYDGERVQAVAALVYSRLADMYCTEQVRNSLSRFFEGERENCERLDLIVRFVPEFNELLVSHTQLYLKDKLDIIASELANGADGAWNKFDKLKKYGGEAVRNEIFDRAVETYRESFVKFANELMDGNDKAIRENLKKFGNTDDGKEIVERLEAEFKEFLDAYIRADGRLEGMAEAVLNDEVGQWARQKAIAVYLPDIGALISETIDSIALNEKQTVIDGIALGDYEKVYERLKKLCIHSESIDKKECVKLGLEGYFASEEYAEGFARLSDGVKNKLEFFYNENFYDTVIKNGLLTSLVKPEYLFKEQKIANSIDPCAYKFNEMISLTDCFVAVLEQYQSMDVDGKCRVNEYIKSVVEYGKRHISSAEGDVVRALDESDVIKDILKKIIVDTLDRMPAYSESIVSDYQGIIQRDEFGSLIRQMSDGDKRKLFFRQYCDAAPGDNIKLFFDNLTEDPSYAEQCYRRFAETITPIARMRILTHGQMNSSRVVQREIESGLLEVLCMDGMIDPRTAFDWTMKLSAKLDDAKSRAKLMKHYSDMYGLINVDSETLLKENGYGDIGKNGTEPSADMPYFYRAVRFLNALPDKSDISAECRAVFAERVNEDERDLRRTVKTTAIYMIICGMVHDCHFSLLAEQFAKMEGNGSNVTDDGVKVGAILKSVEDGYLYPTALDVKAMARFKAIWKGNTDGGSYADTLNELIVSRVMNDSDSPLGDLIYASYVDSCDKSVAKRKRISRDQVRKGRKKIIGEHDYRPSGVPDYVVNAVCDCDISYKIEAPVILKALMKIIGTGDKQIVRLITQYNDLVRDKIEVGVTIERGTDVSEEYARLNRYFARRAAWMCVNGNADIRKYGRAFACLFDGSETDDCSNHEFTNALADLMLLVEKPVRAKECIGFLASVFDGRYLGKLKNGISEKIRSNSALELLILEAEG